MPDVWSYWYFQVPNFVLAALVYTLLGRFVLGFFVPADWDNYISNRRKLSQLLDHNHLLVEKLPAPSIFLGRVYILK